MLTYKDRICNLLQYLFIVDLHEVTVRHQQPTPVSSESDSYEPLMECNSRGFTNASALPPLQPLFLSSVSKKFISTGRVRCRGKTDSSVVAAEIWSCNSCMYKVICFKYYIMRRLPVLPGAHIAMRGRRLTWSTMHTRRVFNLHSSTNSSSKWSTIDCGGGFRLFLLGVEINVLGPSTVSIYFISSTAYQIVRERTMVALAVLLQKSRT